MAMMSTDLGSRGTALSADVHCLLWSVTKVQPSASASAAASLR